MTGDRAFDLEDLAILLGLDREEPSDLPDIEAIEAILDRRYTGGWSAPGPGERPGPGLRLVPDGPT